MDNDLKFEKEELQIIFYCVDAYKTKIIKNGDVRTDILTEEYKKVERVYNKLNGKLRA